MKTMLVPVDFSDTAKNALDYAIEWAKAYEYTRIILLKTLYNSMFDMIPSAEYVSVNEDYMTKERDDAKNKLNELCKSLAAKIGTGIKISIAVSELPLVRSILEITEDEHPELIVVGSDNVNYSSNSFVAGNVISIAKISPVRVLIVPSHYSYKSVEQALVPVDFNTVGTLDKIEKHSAKTPQWRNKKLLVLNVDPKEKYLYPDGEFKKNEQVLHEYLQNFSHEVFYSNNKSIIDALTEFAAAHDVQLIIALPGKHSFLYSLTHKSISQAIYENAQHPVLILK
ncbi:MAG TPA: universal stress protein [Chitinophagaceae bacterium]|nr:universal stress protein [Chitinophagaceae bacterium]